MANFQHMYWKKNLELWRHSICFDQLRMASSSLILLSRPMITSKKKKLETVLCKKSHLELYSLSLDFK